MFKKVEKLPFTIWNTLIHKWTGEINESDQSCYKLIMFDIINDFLIEGFWGEF